jgi:hypothetical protein
MLLAFKFLFFTKLFIFINTLLQTSTINNQDICQTGIREDNSNYIYCARQNLTQIPKLFDISSITFKSTIIYDELVLTENQIEELSQYSFDKNLKVRKIYFDLNPIRQISVNSFDNVKNYLEELYFEKPVLLNEEINDEKSLFKNTIFTKCSNLRILSIKNYKIFKIASFELFKLNKLKKLVIKNSNLNYISPDAFKGLEETLVEVDFELNQLNYIPADAIMGLKQMKKLNLAQNQIYNIDLNMFYKLNTNFQTLDLSYNLIKSVTSVDKLQNIAIKSLYLQNNELKWADFMILLKNLINLTDLNMDFNKLNEIPVDNDDIYAYRLPPTNDKQIIKVYNLKELSLQGNNLNEYVLEKFMSSKIKLENLTLLNLARNKLLSIPQDFFTDLNLYSLKTLTLDRNVNLILINSTFSGLEDSLVTLSMNQIGFNFNSIEILNNLKNLQHLKLNGNPQTDSFNTGRLNIPLVTLDAQNSNLILLPKFVCELSSLQELDLSYNKLKTIPQVCLEGKNSLSKLNLNSNPLKCDCKMAYLKSWLDNMYTVNMTADQPFDLFELLFDWRCNEPANLKDKNFINLSKDGLKCDGKSEFAALILQPTTISKKTTTSTTTTTTKMSSTRPTSKFLSFILHDESLISFTNSPSEATTSFDNDPVSLNNSYYIIIGIIFGIATLILSILLLIYTIYIKKFDSYYENSAKKAAEDADTSKTTSDLTIQPSFYDYLQKEPSTTTSNNSNSSIIELFRKNNCDKNIIDSNHYLVSQFNDNLFNNFIHSDAIRNSKIYNSGNGNILIIPNSTISSSFSSFSNSTMSTNVANQQLSTVPYDYYDSKYVLSNFSHYV